MTTKVTVEAYPGEGLEVAVTQTNDSSHSLITVLKTGEKKIITLYGDNQVTVRERQAERVR